nr:SusC/RagA family TonB-linked outer membrane protein [Bacteroides stercorirosoris]
MDALSGQVVGLSVTQSDGRPGSTGTFKVRQPMSFSEGNSASFNQPLIVIDDVVQVDENGEPSMIAFNMLNQSEIESMTVLKDASAAVYGSRASAGVILVKTKRGSVGTPKISYSGKLDFADAVSHAKTMSAYELGVFTNRLYNQADIVNGNNNNAYYKYSPAELEAMKELNYNWLDEAWHSSVSHRHSLTVNGGSEKVTFFAGINYQKQDTNLGDVQDYTKWTFRAGGEVKVTSGLKLSATISGYNSDKVGNNIQTNVGAGPWGNQIASRDYAMLNHMPKYIPWETSIYDEVSGKTESYYVSPWGGPQILDTKPDASVSGTSVWNYFAEEASKSRSYHETNGYSANFSLTYDVPFIKGLNLKGTYAISYNNSHSNLVGDYFTLARAGNTNQPEMHLLGDYTEWGLINYGDPNGDNLDKKPTVKYAKTTSKSEQYSFAISYNRIFGKHDVSATAVVERAEGKGDDLSQLYRGLGLSYGGTSATAGTLSSDAQGTYYRKYESGSLSYIGRASYKYDNRYLAQFVFRSDASTKFAPENYWAFFPTGSIGWVASEEKFFNNSFLGKIFDFLKVRYSLGKTGKDNVEAWKWLQIYNIKPTGGMGFGSLGGQYTSGANINGTANRNIKWDTTIKHNIGLDMNMLDNRLSITTDFYYDKTKDLIMTISDPEEPIYVGAKLPSINYGKKDAWGFELSVRWSDDIKQSLLPSWGPIKYSIGMDYGVSWNKTVLGLDPTFDYPAEAANRSDYTGYHGMGGEYGFRTWKHTSSGDGILRNQADIDNYWDYLTKLAEAAVLPPTFWYYIKRKDVSWYVSI